MAKNNCPAIWRFPEISPKSAIIRITILKLRNSLYSLPWNTDTKSLIFDYYSDRQGQARRKIAPRIEDLYGRTVEIALRQTEDIGHQRFIL